MWDISPGENDATHLRSSRRFANRVSGLQNINISGASPIGARLHVGNTSFLPSIFSVIMRYTQVDTNIVSKKCRC